MIQDLDEFWLRPVTALEQAHLDEQIRLERNWAARRQEEAAQKARKIFGECLLVLKKLGLREAQARSMLGKWRSAMADDEALIKLVIGAGRSNVPDPISYITAAIHKTKSKITAVEAVQGANWTLIGWEAPHKTSRGTRWRGPMRGQVWRDPFGKITILPAPDGALIPTLDEEPGIDFSNA